MYKPVFYKMCGDGEQENKEERGVKRRKRFML